MRKQVDIDKDFKGFNEAFDKLASLLRKDEMSVLDEFLAWVIAQHSYTIKIDNSVYHKEQINAFLNLYNEWVLLQYQKIEKRGYSWFDAFGTFYEDNASSWRRSKKGQFFTPPSICDLMTAITSNSKWEGKSVSDPTCGSGRLILASHAFNPKNYHFGEDIDKTCCMMSALNMMIHGVKGEVVWHDSLNPSSWFDGWTINPQLTRKNPIIHIEKLEKEDSVIFQMWEHRRLEVEAEKAEKAAKLKDYLNEPHKEMNIIFDDDLENQTIIDWGDE